MSMPIPGSTYGTIEFNKKVYPILNSPITSEQIKSVSTYKQKHSLMMSFGHFKTSEYEWCIVENRLYLNALILYGGKIEDTEINSRVRQIGSQNYIKEIFGENQVFADWFSDSIKLEVSRKELRILDGNRPEFKQEIIELFFKEGLLFASKEYERNFIGMRKLKNYIEV